MKTGSTRSARALLMAGVLAGPLSAQTSVTIYNDGRVLVRREVAAAVPKGASSHRVALGSLDPASIFALDSGVAITRLTYDGATDEGSVLRRSVGRRVVFRLPESKDTLSAARAGRRSAAAPAAGRAGHLPAAGSRALSRRRRGRRSDREPRALEHPAARSPPPRLLHRRRQLAGELSGDAGRHQRAGRRHGGARIAGPSGGGRRRPAPGRLGGPGGQAAGPAAPADGTAARRRWRWPMRPRWSSGWASSISIRCRARAPCSRG